jgi:hypothetical protein
MSREYRLHKLLKNPHVWRPGDLSASDRSNVPSGFAELDRQLGGGWPVGVLTEILLGEPGIGELGLLLPAVRSLCGDDHGQDHFAGTSGHPPGTPAKNPSHRLAWIAPPYMPYAPALAQHGLDVSRMLVVQSGTQVDALWAMEQALRSSVCIAVLGWFADADDRSMRRLQLAAEAAACWAVIFRPARFITSSSPAPLRVHIKPGGKAEARELDLQILRNRYGPAGSLSLQC